MDKKTKKSKTKNKKQTLLAWMTYSLIFALLAIMAFGVFFVLNLERSGKDVNIIIEAPEEIKRGVPFDVVISIHNNLEKRVDNVTLIINLPNSITSLRETGNRIEVPFGSIGTSSFSKRTFKFVTTEEAKKETEIQIRTVYASETGATFETSENAKFNVVSPPISIELEGADIILAGARTRIGLKYQNHSSDLNEFSNIAIQIEYPPTMKFISASLPPDSLNNYWRLGALNAGSKGSLEIEGEFLETRNKKTEISVIVFNNISGKDFPLVQEKFLLELAPSPISLEILTNNRENYNAKPGEKLQYNILYKNQSGVALSNVIISASFSGELLDFEKIQTNGKIQNLTKTVTWDSQTNPEFRRIEPGKIGQVKVGVELKDLNIRRIGDKNFSINITAKLESPTVPHYLDAIKTTVKSKTETKIKGKASIEAFAFHRDPASGIVNRGTMPLKVGEETEFTIHWRIKNHTTDIRNAKIQAELMPNVSWTGITKSNTETVPIFNEPNIVSWEIPFIPATQGIINEAFYAIFQISAEPKQNQVGDFMALLDESIIKATDEFTGEYLQNNFKKLDSSLPHDQTINVEKGLVQP